MVGVLDCGPPVVVESQLAGLPAGAQEEAGADQGEAGGVALHVGVVRSVGQTVPATLRVQTFLQAPEHDIAVIISCDQPDITIFHTGHLLSSTILYLTFLYQSPVFEHCSPVLKLSGNFRPGFQFLFGNFPKVNLNVPYPDGSLRAARARDAEGRVELDTGDLGVSQSVESGEMGRVMTATHWRLVTPELPQLLHLWLCETPELGSAVLTGGHEEV